MKKLMMAVAIVCAAVSAQAVSIKWRVNTTIYDGTDSGSYGSGTGYLFFESPTGTGYNSISRSSLLTMLETSSLATIAETYGVGTAGSIDSSTGKIAYTTESTTMRGLKANDTANMYIVIDGGNDNYYFSAIKSGVGIQAGEEATPVSFTGTGSNSQTFIEASDLSTASNGGWVNVPEPTSGLLLLLGVAGLALRRRRA